MTAGILGTVNHRCGGQVWPSANTTPESLDLQRLLAQMRTAGATHAVMEVASHGLALKRVDGCAFDVGVFTNLTQDHLDFHGDMERYWLSKKRLFTNLLPAGGKDARVVINQDNPHGRELAREMAGVCPLLTFGFDQGNDIWPSVDRSDLNGSRGVIHTLEGDLPFNSPMVGRHNIENLLAAAGAALALGLPRDAIQAGFAAATGAPGRLERVADAHGRRQGEAAAPDALEARLVHDSGGKAVVRLADELELVARQHLPKTGGLVHWILLARRRSRRAPPKPLPEAEMPRCANGARGSYIGDNRAARQQGPPRRRVAAQVL